MRKRLFYTALVGVAAISVAQGPGTNLLNQHATALKDAKTLTVEYTVQPLAGAPVRYKLELAKPSFVKIDSDEELIVVDGKEVVSYDKKAKTYLKQPFTQELLAGTLSKPDLALWAPFFDSKAFEKVQGARAMGTKARKGMNLRVVEIAWPGKIPKGTLYLSTADSIVRQAEWTVKDIKGDQTMILDTKTLSLTGSADPANYAFKAPAGSRQTTLEELNAVKWYTDFNEALAAAAKGNKLVFIDFYTDWCTWCKELRKNVFSTKQFKDMSKNYVFLEIDAEAQPSLAQSYQVNAYPTCVITDSKGTLVHKIIGYKEADPFVAEMKKAAGL